MALLVELSGEHPKMASHEAWAAAIALGSAKARVLWLDGSALILGAPGTSASDLAARLGLAHHVSEGVISGEVEAAVKLAASVEIGDARSFRVRVRRLESTSLTTDPKALESQVGRLIVERTGARVDLTSPAAEVRLVLGEKAHAGLLGGTVDRKAMEARAVRHRPFSQPVSIHPKYARAMVNMAQVAPGGTLMDPFCGTGGILIEAALMGCRAMGSDIDPRMVQGTRRNLKAMGLASDLRVADVADAGPTSGGNVHAVVTDPPYGRSTSLHGDDPEDVIERLYEMAGSVLFEGGHLVVCLPSPEHLPEEGGPLKVEAVHPMKVHKSLTRHVCVLSR